MLLRELLSEAWSEKYKRSINCNSPKGFSQRAHCQGRKKEEDYHPNDTPPGPETKPTMPAGTVRVDVSDVYDWYKLGKNIPNLGAVDAKQFGKGPPSTIFSFGSEEEEHKYINDLMKLGLTTTDLDPVDPKQPKGMRRQKVDPTFNVAEAKKRKKKTRKAAYGPGPYGGYGYYSGYSGEGGDGGGIGEETKQIGYAPNLMEIFERFLPIAMKVLAIKKLPRIKLHKYINDQEQPTFGRFLNNDVVIDIGLADRHPNDILRTLAHELAHYKQLLDQKLGPHSGDTGSPEENEAHAKAGIIMRHFNKRYPQYLSAKPLSIQEAATAGATAAGSIASVPNPHYSPGPARGKKSYTGSPGKSGTKAPPQPKPRPQKPGDNALDMKGVSLFGSGTIKR